MGRKYYENSQVLFVSSRVEEGLPIVASPLMNFLVWGVLAQASQRFMIKVCDFVIMQNHFHFLFVVEDPQDVSGYMQYVKQEISHRINRLLDRRKKTIWCNGYDSPVLLTVDDVIEKIVYIHSNPAKANLVESISEYPGVSSWSMLITGNYQKICPFVGRDEVPHLWSPAISISEQKQIVQSLEAISETNCTFTLEPFAWMKCFQELRNVTPEEMQKKIEKQVELSEENLAQDRKEKGISVIGITALRRQSITKPHTPTSFGRKMYCISSDEEKRVAYLDKIEKVFHKGKEVYEKWKQGDLTAKMPPGLYAPRVPVLISAMPLKL